MDCCILCHVLSIHLFILLFTKPKWVPISNVDINQSRVTIPRISHIFHNFPTSIKKFYWQISQPDFYSKVIFLSANSWTCGNTIFTNEIWKWISWRTRGRLQISTLYGLYWSIITSSVTYTRRSCNVTNQCVGYDLFGTQAIGLNVT